MTIAQVFIILLCSLHINSELSHILCTSLRYSTDLYQVTPSNVTSKLTILPRHNTHNLATPPL